MLLASITAQSLPEKIENIYRFSYLFFSAAVRTGRRFFHERISVKPKRRSDTTPRMKKKIKENNAISSRKVYPNRFSAVEQHNIWWNEILYFDTVYVRWNSNTLLLRDRAKPKRVCSNGSGARIRRWKTQRRRIYISFGFPPFYSSVHVVCAVRVSVCVCENSNFTAFHLAIYLWANEPVSHFSTILFFLPFRFALYFFLLLWDYFPFFAREWTRPFSFHRSRSGSLSLDLGKLDSQFEFRVHNVRVWGNWCLLLRE